MKYLFVILMSIILFSGVLFVVHDLNTSHEMAHKSIAESHTCKSGHVYIGGIFKQSYFHCDEFHTNMTADVVQNEETLHNVNEIVSYNIVVVILSMFICTFSLMMTYMYFQITK